MQLIPRFRQWSWHTAARTTCLLIAGYQWTLFGQHATALACTHAYVSIVTTTQTEVNIVIAVRRSGKCAQKVWCSIPTGIDAAKASYSTCCAIVTVIAPRINDMRTRNECWLSLPLSLVDATVAATQFWGVSPPLVPLKQPPPLLLLLPLATQNRPPCSLLPFSIIYL